MREKILCLVTFLFLGCAGTALADVQTSPFVSPMFGDNMVLQRDKPNSIWGWATPGEKVTVEIAGKSVTAVAGADGRWQTEFRPPAVGGPYALKVYDADQRVEFHEVLVGDVWLCGGQSNMEFGLTMARNGTNEVLAANHPELRLFIVAKQVSYVPTNLLTGTWRICSPDTVATDGWNGFSAVAYFFGKRLQDRLHVPIGLVEDCWGGTPAESWMAPTSLRKLKSFDAPLDEIDRLAAKGGPEYGSFLMHWLDEYDIGNNLWGATNFDDSSWKTVTIPGGFSDLGVGDVPAICWFRKEITLPNPLPPGKATLRLGPIEKMDTTYINGQWVGASSWVENPRAYGINDGVLQPGKNLIAIRVFKSLPTGGFIGKPDDLKIVLGDNTEVPLAGGWKAALSCDARPPHPMPLTLENYPTMPEVLYLGMIDPVAPLAIRGAIWYQGEANFQRAWQYRTLLPNMIGDWRKAFGQGDFPFYIVSLPQFMAHRDQPGDDAWAELREAQAFTASTVKNSALIVTVDTGDANNIHPTDKKTVGDRLAYSALATEYGKKIPDTGPAYKSFKQIPGALKIRFTHADGGLVVKGDKLGEFSIAGADHQWHWANAKIDGDSVIVSSPDVSAPVAVRYAWQANPEATLFNGAGFPAAPFRTDDWPLSTVSAKPW
ncbi:MAG TPA: sialate O-acetylesterase [Verrucomicrobiae bacterium]|jgi:sialate O-acetylesterase